MIVNRHPENPIVQPGKYPWRQACVFNPGVVRGPDGIFYMLERAAAGLRPFTCDFGLLKSKDGEHFEHVSDQPVLTAKELGFPYGGVQDPRVIHLDGTYYCTYVLSRWRPNCIPNGVTVPDYEQNEYPDLTEENRHKSRDAITGIATSKDMQHWEHLAYIPQEGDNDRDNILFPQKIGNRYALLRRPVNFIGEKYGISGPGMWLSYSEDLKNWSPMELIAGPVYEWEGEKIGGSTVPIKTDKGWLTIYHGVDAKGTYQIGAMLLDLDNPTRILHRTPEPIMKPEEYYERVGLVLPNCLFANSAILVEDALYIYYGVCDTAICLATVSFAELMDHLQRCPGEVA